MPTGGRPFNLIASLKIVPYEENLFKQKGTYDTYKQKYSYADEK